MQQDILLTLQVLTHNYSTERDERLSSDKEN